MAETGLGSGGGGGGATCGAGAAGLPVWAKPDDGASAVASAATSRNVPVEAAAAKAAHLRSGGN
jgi:hypothetical protein